MYSHVGRRAAVGHYAVTADAVRTPGVSHALNVAGRSYRSLCGVVVAADHADHFLGQCGEAANPILPCDDPAARVTCRRCRRVILGPRLMALIDRGRKGAR